MDYEIFVQNYFKEKLDINLQKIPECSSERSPDFELLDNELCVFVAELKTITRYPPSEETGWTVTHYSDIETGAIRDDNSPNRVANLIEKAYSQLKNRPEPKIVILLNDSSLDILDLREAIDGYLDFQDHSNRILRNTKSAHIAKRLKPTLDQLDAVIWIEKRYLTHQYLHNSERGAGIGYRYFPERDF